MGSEMCIRDSYITGGYRLLSLLVKIMAFNIVENKKNSTCCGEFEEDRVKEAYRISFAFLVYKDICKREPLVVYDIKKAAARF